MLAIDQLTATNPDDNSSTMELFGKEAIDEFDRLCCLNHNENPNNSFERPSTPNIPEMLDDDLDFLLKDDLDSESKENPLYNEILTDLKSTDAAAPLEEDEQSFGYNIKGDYMSWQQLESSLSGIESSEIGWLGLTGADQDSEKEED